jgi:nitrate reductase (NAD(P)H)
VWIVVHDHIYDNTKFLMDHLSIVDTDTNCTEEFDAIHNDKAKALLDTYCINELLTTDTRYNSVHGSPCCHDPKAF